MRGWIMALVIFATACGGQAIDRSDYGADWPFTVESARIFCDNGAAWISIDGAHYGLTGYAQTLRGLPPLDRSLWRNNPSIPGTKVSLSPVIADALALC